MILDKKWGVFMEWDDVSMISPISATDMTKRLGQDKNSLPEKADLPFWLLDSALPGQKPVARWSQTEFHDGDQKLEVVLPSSPVPYIVVVVPEDAHTRGFFTLQVSQTRPAVAYHSCN